MKTSKMTKIVVALFAIATVLAAVNVVFGISIPTAQSGGVSSINNTVGNVLGIVTFICYAAAVIMLMMLGIKYVTSSPEGKAEVKKSAVIYVIGAVLVFAAGTVLTVIQNMATTTVVA